MSKLSDYSAQKAKQITFIEGDFYPDALETAIELYQPVLEKFGQLLKESKDSCDLFRRIFSESKGKQRIQLLRVFRKYVSPDTSVEMTKKKSSIEDICTEFGNRFRPLAQVKSNFDARPMPDEALIALLNEYRTRGQKGYGLTANFFEWFENTFDDQGFEIAGPTGAGRDINLAEVLPEYPRKERPVDFTITENGKLLVVGLAHYDSDRGGGQEDDRTGGYNSVISEVLGYADKKRMHLKILLVNDGPGLLLGSMWRDYCLIEETWPDRVMVCTLKMLKERVTPEWLRS